MIIVLLKDGTETTLAAWQKIYGLEVGSDKIGKYFSLEEPKFAENLRQYKKLVICEPLMMLMDRVREKRGKSSIIKGFNRSKEYQKQLQKDDRFEAALNSPHTVYMAADQDTVSKKDSEELAKIVIEAAKELGIKVRVGWKQYLNMANPMTFVHYDVCPMYYAVGKPHHHLPHPWQWEKEARW